MADYDWIPYLQGKYMTYNQIIAMILSAVALLFSFISLLAYLIFGKMRIHPKLQSLAFKTIFYSLSLVPLLCAALDAINILEGTIGMIILLFIGMLLQNGCQKWYQELYECHNTATASILTYLKLSFQFKEITRKKILKILAFSILSNLFMYKTCISFYNAQLGLESTLLGISFNSYVMRLFQLKTACPPGPPCHLYTTVPEDPDKAFFLNIHTHTDVEEVTVFYRELSASQEIPYQNVTAKTINYQGLEWRTARNVHSALIMDLKPNTKYLTRVFYQNKFWTNGIYKTLTNDPNVRVRMINAGDSGYCPGAVNLSKIVATLNPDIFFMGGDIAYDNNIPACSYTWDYFLNMYGQITASLGYMMPIITSVGNHDVGLNQLSGINITVNNQGPAFLIYFPIHYDRDSNFKIIKQVPPIQNRRTMASFSFSHIHFIILDSGYLHGFDGWQKQYLYSQLSANQGKVKFVNYHVPIYGSCEGFDRNPQRFLYALFHWVPAFDKFKVITIFQNHVHSFKRTKPLISSSPVEKGGTVYLGDGSYGAFNQLGCHPDATIGIFDTVGANNNFWVTDVYLDRVEHKAYNSHGIMIDSFVQNISDYKIEQNQKTKKNQSVEILLPSNEIYENIVIQS